MKQYPEVRRIWFTAFVIQLGHGCINGLFLYIWGPHFYDHFTHASQAGTAMTITMLLFAFRQGLVALLEVPTGALADTIGRGHVTILAFAVRSVFFLGLAAMAFCTQLSTAVFWAALASIAYAVSYTFFNGAFSAWCADTLRERAPTVPYAWLSSRYVVYQGLGEIVGAVFSIWLYLRGVPFAAFLIGAGVAYALMGFSIPRLKEPAVTTARGGERLVLLTIVRQIGLRIAESIGVVRKQPVICWVVLVYGAYMFLVSVMIHMWPIYLRTVTGAAHLSRAWIGVALVTLTLNLIGARLFVWINDRWTQRGKGPVFRFAAYRKLYTGTAVWCALSVLTLSVWSVQGQAPFAIFIVALGTVLFCGGSVMSGFDILVNSFITADQAQSRATIVSAGSVVRSLLTLILAIPAGGVSAEQSPVGWALPAGLLLVAAVGAARSLHSDERRRATVEGGAAYAVEQPGVALRNADAAQ